MPVLRPSVGGGAKNLLDSSYVLQKKKQQPIFQETVAGPYKVYG